MNSKNVIQVTKQKFLFSFSVTMRHIFSMNRVAPLWKKQPEQGVSSPSLNSLESSLGQLYKQFDCLSLK